MEFETAQAYVILWKSSLKSSKKLRKTPDWLPGEWNEMPPFLQKEKS